MKYSPLEEWVSAAVARHKQAHASNASIEGSIIREKALKITAHLGPANSRGSNGWIKGFNRRHNTVYRTLTGESRNADSKIVMTGKMTNNY
jgi:hypothetical protein